MTESSTTADSSGALSNSFTTTTNQSLNIVADKEGAEGLAQMPLPNDEKSIRKVKADEDEYQ